VSAAGRIFAPKKDPRWKKGLKKTPVEAMKKKKRLVMAVSVTDPKIIMLY